MLNKVGNKQIETKRLLLREFTINDIDGMFSNWATDIETCKMLSWDVHANKEITEAVIKKWIEDYKNPFYFNWVVELKRERQIIGNISCVKFDIINESCEIGYCYGSKYWHNGYATEALKAVIQFLIEKIGLRIIIATHIKENPASGRVMAKAGMRLDAVLRERRINKNTKNINDLMIYSITKDEYVKEEFKVLPGMLKKIENEEEKSNIARKILFDLPDWFGIEEYTLDFIKQSSKLPFFALFINNEAIGFIALKQTSKYTAEIYCMGILKQYHRNGYGKKLYQFFEDYAQSQGYKFIQVKTIIQGMYKAYDQTNSFYKSMGFYEFEVFPTVNDEDNPCLILVKAISNGFDSF